MKKNLTLLFGLIFTLGLPANEYHFDDDPYHAENGIQTASEGSNVFRHRSHRRGGRLKNRKRWYRRHSYPRNYNYSAYICRRGYYYCAVPYPGPVGAPCYCLTWDGYLWFHGSLSYQ